MKQNLHVLEIAGTWEPDDAERRAAWELYVELVTRVSVVPLREDEGLLREALSSLYSLFATTQEVLRHGPELAEPKRSGQYNFGYLAVAMLNFAIRPLLAEWHPQLEDWESQRPADRSRRDHERVWTQADELCHALADTRQALDAYADLLPASCGVPNLLAVVPQPECRTQLSSSLLGESPSFLAPSVSQVRSLAVFRVSGWSSPRTRRRRS